MSDVKAYDRPIPVPDETTAEFWASVREHAIKFQRCQHCGNFAHLPVSFCRSCHNLRDPSFAYEPVSGRGTVICWTVIVEQMVAGFQGAEPIVHALVAFDEQRDLTFPAPIIGDTSALVLGSPVEVVYVEVTEGVTLPYFQLVDAGSGNG